MKKKQITNSILLVLEKAVDGMVDFNNFLNNPGPAGLGWHHYIKKSQVALAIKRLRENGLIDFISDDKLAVRLTDKGKDRALWLKMINTNEPWDGKWRIVIWDIPEKRRLARDLLRYKLKQLGFERLQKSVWVCKKNCTEELRNFIRKTGIGDWVMVIESNNIK